GTLHPVYRGVKQGPATVMLDYSPAGVTGKIMMSGQVMPISAELEAPVFGSDAGLDVVLCALPLETGYKTTLRTFDVMSSAAQVFVLEVTGIENVTVPAGTYEAFKLELRQMDGSPGGGTVYVRTGDKRYVVRSVMQLPAMAGGGTVTTELKSVK
ncbi:MAG TPA: hypothetical protein VLA34_04155, partial [Candidatus Krumholzibacterium sp.]|nr:hypothetical protein [Candidatus Krumholzibacterium sp.]